MNILNTMKEKLTVSFKPVHIEVADDSASHYGHDGASPGTVSHVAIRIVSDAFEGKSRVERSRMAFAAIADEVRQVHAITQLVTRTAAEEQEHARKNSA